MISLRAEPTGGRSEGNRWPALFRCCVWFYCVPLRTRNGRRNYLPPSGAPMRRVCCLLEALRVLRGNVPRGERRTLHRFRAIVGAKRTPILRGVVLCTRLDDGNDDEQSKNPRPGAGRASVELERWAGLWVSSGATLLLYLRRTVSISTMPRVMLGAAWVGLLL